MADVVDINRARYPSGITFDEAVELALRDGARRRAARTPDDAEVDADAHVFRLFRERRAPNGGSDVP